MFLGFSPGGVKEKEAGQTVIVDINLRRLLGFAGAMTFQANPPLLRYNVNNVTFHCCALSRRPCHKVYFKDNYYLLRLKGKEEELRWDMQRAKSEKEPYYLFDETVEDCSKEDIYTIGLFKSGRKDLSDEKRIRQMKMLHALNYEQKYSRMIGFACLASHKSDKGKVVLNGGYIIPQHRGQGLTRLMYQARLAWALEQGFRSVITMPHHENKASVAACQSFGFALTANADRQKAAGQKFLEQELSLKRYAQDLQHYRFN